MALNPASVPGELSYPDDEIDLGDLILALWAGKWLILSITLACTLSTLIYIQIFPIYTVSFKIWPNPRAEAHIYDELNAVAKSLDVYDEDKDKDRDKSIFVSNNSLLQLWVEDLNSYKTLEQALIDHEYLSKKADETEQEFNHRLRLAAYQYKLSPDPKDKQSPWSMKFTSSMPDTDRLVLRQAFSQSNSNVRAVLEGKFRSNIRSYSQKSSTALAALDRKKENLLITEGEKNKKRVGFLKEQSQIAHVLDMPIPSILMGQSRQSPSTNNNNNNNNNNNDDTPTSSYDYLRGFEAIEAEMDLLQNRKVEVFSSKLIELRSRQRELQQDPKIADSQLIFNAAPISSDDFRAVRYDLTDLQVSNKSPLILALAVMVGGMLGMLVLLIRNAVSAASNRSTARLLADSNPSYPV